MTRVGELYGGGAVVNYIIDGDVESGLVNGRIGGEEIVEIIARYVNESALGAT